MNTNKKSYHLNNVPPSENRKENANSIKKNRKKYLKRMTEKCNIERTLKNIPRVDTISLHKPLEISPSRNMLP